jgi:hypothetical protein
VPGRFRRSKIEDSGTPLVSNSPEIRIRGALRTFLESERDVLIKTQSLLVCIAQAMVHEYAPTDTYYPDAVGLAAALLKRRVFNLDELLLDGQLPVGKCLQSH